MATVEVSLPQPLYNAKFCYFLKSNAYKFAMSKCNKTHIKQCENQLIFRELYSHTPAYRGEEGKGREGEGMDIFFLVHFSY
jgi:hypothetical protein